MEASSVEGARRAASSIRRALARGRGVYPAAMAANVEQAKYWNEVAGPRWVKFQETLDTELSALSGVALDRAGLAAGEAVLDVGCGCGGTALELGRRVGPGGSVLGVDLSNPMLARARERAAAERLAHVSFRQADAQTEPFAPGAFDLVFSRFGVMFFADPPAAFANLCRALRPGGRVTFVCWQKLVENEWVTLPLAAVAKLVQLPPPPPPGAPGPFAFADPDRVRGILAAGGFSDIAIEDVRLPLALGGGGLDGAVEFSLEIGPVASALREAEAGPELRAQAADAIREALAPFAAAGSLRMPSAAWVATARRAG
jgi:SAM-dependent methyltransferase